MISALQKHFEKILLGAAVAALVAGAGWTWRQNRSPGKIRQARPSPVLASAAYVPTMYTARDDSAVTWRKAPAQSAGDGWVYELFTPPVIYYNATARSFAVTTPDGAGREVQADLSVQLLAVRLEPYRLQLTGYFGSVDDYVAAFAVSGSSEVVLAREGQRFAQLGLTLKGFEVRKMRLDHDDPWPAYDVAGVATLLDERTGTEVELDSRARKLTNTPMAVMKMAGRGKPRELHEGDTWAEGEIAYRIERIQLEPAEVVVARNVPGLLLPELRTMRPAAAASSQNNSTSHPRNVANSGP